MSDSGFWGVATAAIEVVKALIEKGNGNDGGPTVIINMPPNGDSTRNNGAGGNIPTPKKPKRTSKSNGKVTLEAIQLYSTGISGKVYTTTFYKSVNHNFGVEVTIKNSTNRHHPVQVGLCVYDQHDNPVHNFKGSSTFTVNANSTAVQPIFVDAKAFAQMKVGTYKYQIWVNNQSIMKDYFTVL